MKKLSGPIPEEVLGKISVSVSIVSNAFTCNSLSFTCKEVLILLNLNTCNFAKLISHSSVFTCKLYKFMFCFPATDHVMIAQKILFFKKVLSHPHACVIYEKTKGKLP